VPVAYEVAKSIGADLDVLLVRKLGAPGHEELGIGAIVDGDKPQVVLNPQLVRMLSLPPGYIQRQAEQQYVELERRRREYLGGREQRSVEGRTVIVVDDGIATGGTVRAALEAIRKRKPAKLVLAVPVAPEDSLRELEPECDPGGEEQETEITKEEALSIPVEYASERKIRERNKLYYRFNHWPIWIFVFFIAPGPLTFDLFEHGFDSRLLIWLGLVLIGTAIAGLRGRLPGCEPRPYIIRFTEDRPNPLYRRVCYTTAWGEVIAFAVLNIAGLGYAVLTSEWRLKQMYEVAYFPIAGSMWLLGALGYLPRVKRSTKGEGHERRYFYGSVWAVAIAQPILWLMWKVLPQTRVGDSVKLMVFLAILAVVGHMSRLGMLPRTRPIVPGELAVSD